MDGTDQMIYDHEPPERIEHSAWQGWIEVRSAAGSWSAQ